MVKKLLSWVVFFGVLTAQASDLQLGVSTPQFQAKLLDDQTLISSAQLKGHVVLINFWATWCGPCKEEMPAIEAYYQKHKAEGFDVLAISMDDPKNIHAVNAYAKSYSFWVAHKSQANVSELGRVWRLPSSFVLDREGVLRKNGHVGDPQVNAELLENLVTPLLLQPKH